MELDIYGFLIVYPIKFSASEALFLIVGWALLRHVERVGTIIGKDVWSCLAEQLAIIPRIQIYEILTLQFGSVYKPVSKCGSNFLTE